jgi:hypothetical protein
LREREPVDELLGIHRAEDARRQAGVEALSAERREARRRLDELAPILSTYYLDLEFILSPFLTISPRPNLATSVLTLDSRGYRLSRVGEATVASDAAPDDATFLLGASYAFGVGAEDDSGTLASALWRRSGRPCVNLGLPRGSSTHDLISALPFGNRATTFVVAGGGNNVFAVVNRAPTSDPLMGPTHLDHFLRKLREPTVEELIHVVWAAGRGRAGRWKPRPRLPRRRPDSDPREDPEAILAEALAFQLRDLRALRRMVPDEAEVVFALNPFALKSKQLTEEEKAILETLEVIHGGGGRGDTWALAESHWDALVAATAEGCAEIGVRFVNLSDAPYTGWCFVDEVHTNARGYDIAASFLLESLD